MDPILWRKLCFQEQYTEGDIMKMLEFLVENIFVVFGLFTTVYKLG